MDLVTFHQRMSLLLRMPGLDIRVKNDDERRELGVFACAYQPLLTSR